MNSKYSRIGISNHFSREAKLMVGICLFVFVLGLLAAIFIPEIKQFFDVDRCLDAGGAFDYKANTCVGTGRLHDG